MWTSVIRSFEQFRDPAFRRVILIGLFSTLLLYGALVGVSFWLIFKSNLFQQGWMEWSFDFLGSLLVLILPLLIFPSIIMLIISFFVDDIADAVEEKYYPDLSEPYRQSVFSSFSYAIKFIILSAFLNLLALIFVYWIPGPNFILFYALNGYLLGREYFDLIASRHLQPLAVKALRHRFLAQYWFRGMLIALLLSIPMINILTPILACAFMTHEFERLRRIYGYI